MDLCRLDLSIYEVRQNNPLRTVGHLKMKAVGTRDLYPNCFYGLASPYSRRSFRETGLYVLLTTRD
jgi:hypothetical protein